MRATITGVLRHVESKLDSKGKKFAVVSLEQSSFKGKPYFVDVCTYDLDGREVGKPATFECNVRATAGKTGGAFLNAWEVQKDQREQVRK